MPTLYINGSFYVFGQQVESEDVTASAVAKFDPFENGWTILGGYGPARKRFSVLNTTHGVIIVDGENEKLKLCSMSPAKISCGDIENSEQESTVWDGEPILFTFENTQCPKSLAFPVMLVLTTTYLRSSIDTEECHTGIMTGCHPVRIELKRTIFFLLNNN